MTETKSAAEIAAGVKVRAPMLTDLEKVVFDHCAKTGETVEEALTASRVLHMRITRFMVGKIRTAHVQAKLESNVGWLREQLGRMKAGVRDLRDEPEFDPDFANRALAEAEYADRLEREAGQEQP